MAQLSEAEAVYFNPRARAGRDKPNTSATGKATYFNPRARAGRDYTYVFAYGHDLISIHAPVRGAT